MAQSAHIYYGTNCSLLWAIQYHYWPTVQINCTDTEGRSHQHSPVQSRAEMPGHGSMGWAGLAFACTESGSASCSFSLISNINLEEQIKQQRLTLMLCLWRDASEHLHLNYADIISQSVIGSEIFCFYNLLCASGSSLRFLKSQF